MRRSRTRGNRGVVWSGLIGNPVSGGTWLGLRRLGSGRYRAQPAAGRRLRRPARYEIPRAGARSLYMNAPLAGKDRERWFARICEELRPDLFRFAFWLSRDREVAEDVVQESLLRAWRSRDSLDAAGSARHWLRQVQSGSVGGKGRRQRGRRDRCLRVSRLRSTTDGRCTGGRRSLRTAGAWHMPPGRRTTQANNNCSFEPSTRSPRSRCREQSAVNGPSSRQTGSRSASFTQGGCRHSPPPEACRF